MRRALLPSAEKLLLTTFLALATFSTASLLSSITRAEEAPLWGPQAGDFTVRVEDKDYTPPKDAGEYCSYKDFTLRVKYTIRYRQYGYKDETYNLCARNYSFGEVASTGGRGVLQFKVSDEPYYFDRHYSGNFVHVPNTSSLFELGATLQAYDNPVEQLELNPGHGGTHPTYDYLYEPKEGATPRILKDSDGNAVEVDEVDASPNGDWMIADLGSGDRLARVDPDTFDMLTFRGGVVKYSPYADPDVDMAISNDGRYAAMAGGYHVTFKLYDLSTCVPEAQNSRNVATGCDPPRSQMTLQHLAEQLGLDFVAGDRVHRLYHLQFNDDGTELSATAVIKYASGETETKRIALIAPGHGEPKLDYLALGDSFSSGEGSYHYLPGTDGTDEYPEEKCHLSAESYPYLLAGGYGLVVNGQGRTFASVACSGAVREDIKDDSDGYLGQFGSLTEADQEFKKQKALQAFIPGRAAQIEFVKKYKPKAITIGIGGNDIGFADKLTACVANSAIQTCKLASSDLPGEGKEIQAQYEMLKQLYNDLKEASDGQTKIYAVGYPDFINSEVEVCRALNVGLNKTERRFIDEGISYLNDVTEAAARATGVTYVDIEDSLAGKELCSMPQPFVYANGLSLGDDNYWILGNESFHPTPEGHYEMAMAVNKGTGNILTHQPCPLVVVTYPYCPDDNVEEPPIPDYFGVTEPGYITKKIRDFTDAVVQGVDRTVEVVTQGLKSFTQATIWVESTRLDLGDYPVDENGKLNTDITLPNNLEPGYHTVHIQGTAPSGEPVHYYQFVLLTGPEDDVDGDGVPDEEDSCLFVPPANADQDGDGIDDACDPYIEDLEEFPLPPAPTVTTTDPVNDTNQQQMVISGTGDQATTVRVMVDDENPDTAAVEAMGSVDSGNYSTAVDVSSLDDGALSATVRLENQYGQGPSTTAAATKDTKRPETTATVTPELGDNGWNKDDTVITLKAADHGMGVKQITYSATGAQDITETTVQPADGEDIAEASIPITAEGVTTVTYFATDKAGNVESKQTSTIRIDSTTPITAIDQRHHSVVIPAFGGRLTGAANDQHSGIATTKVILQNVFPRNQHYELTANCVSGCNTQKARWEVTPNDIPTGLYIVTAYSIDNAGNEGPSTPPMKVIVVQIGRWFR